MDTKVSFLGQLAQVPWAIPGSLLSQAPPAFSQIPQPQPSLTRGIERAPEDWAEPGDTSRISGAH
jgi:hypothetical protein